MAKIIPLLLFFLACHKKTPATESEMYIIRDEVLESLDEDAFDYLPEEEADTALPEEEDLLDEES